MRLADFILGNMEAILANWEAFAAGRMPAARHMDSFALRDHAEQILHAIALDLSRPQTKEAQNAKSLGLAVAEFDASDTAAEIHAVLRARSGFDINQLVSEYRALRASVLRLWLDGAPSTAERDDLIRFNEAVDQALAESVTFFSAKVEQSRNLFLGMLGHDLRTPLQTIQMTSGYLGRLNAGEEVSAAASRLVNSGKRMQGLLDDLLDFNRTNLGTGIHVLREEVDLALAVTEQVDQIRAAYPELEVELSIAGDTHGQWDIGRLQQLLDNLVVNAAKYGTSNEPVQVLLSGGADEVRLEIKNSGSPPESMLQEMFAPLRRGLFDQNQSEHRDGLGLGLYIAREIAKAHGGSIEPSTTEKETTFVVTLPRRLTEPAGLQRRA